MTGVVILTPTLEELTDPGMKRIIETAGRLVKLAEHEAECRNIHHQALSAMADFRQEGAVSEGQYKAAVSRLTEAMRV